MIDFDIIDINEAIEELNILLSDVKERKDEIEDEHQKEIRDKVLLALNNAGYNIPLDKNGNLSLAYEESDHNYSYVFL